MSVLPTVFPHVPLKQMDPSMLILELDREARSHLPESRELITSAASVASFLHRRQTRFLRGGMPRVPYIEHPLRVALRLVRWGVRDPYLIAAALLHDVVEDCSDELLTVFGRQGETPVRCLARLYGEDTAEHVERVTNPVDVVDARSYQRHVAALAWSETPAVLIKASDLKDNAGSIRHQLGHGQDERMLRMLSKYRPAVREIAQGLSAVPLAGEPVLARAAAAAALHELAADLDALAGEQSIAV